jgi:hypothetical protein
MHEISDGKRTYKIYLEGYEDCCEFSGAICRKTHELIEQGVPLIEAFAKADVDAPTLCRWFRRFFLKDDPTLDELYFLAIVVRYMHTVDSYALVMEAERARHDDGTYHVDDGSHYLRGPVHHDLWRAYSVLSLHHTDHYGYYDM